MGRSDVWKGVPRVPTTSAPILLVSMLFDPITPLPAAQQMHSLFPGSGLLVGNNSGVSFAFVLLFENIRKKADFETVALRTLSKICMSVQIRETIHA